MFSVISLFLFFVQTALASNSFMGIVGDAGLVGPELSSLKASIKTTSVRSLILPGDNCYFGTYDSIWRPWKRDGFQFDVVAIGNHHKGYDKEVAYFGMPGEFYSVVKSGARFLVLNSDNQGNLDAQFTWLNQELARASEKLIFLVYHHPTYSVGSDDSWTQRQAFQLRLRPILKMYDKKITALLLGHAHISAILNFGTVPAVVAGSGREVLKAHPVNYVDDGVLVQTRYLAPETRHWAALEIAENSQEAWIHFVSLGNQRRVCTAHFFEGRMVLGAECK